MAAAAGPARRQTAGATLRSGWTAALDVRLSRLYRRKVVNGLTVLTLVLGSIFILLPFVWVLDTAFEPPQYAFVVPPHFPYTPTMANFDTIFHGADAVYGAAIVHSLILMVISVACAVAIGAPGGYALARAKFRGRRAVVTWMIVSFMIPGLIYMVPLSAMYEKLDITGSYLAVILLYETWMLPFFMFVIRGYFADIPMELDDAARVDGCTRFMAFRKVILPLVAPGLSTVALLAAITSWNEFFGALLFTGPSDVTAPVVLYSLIGGEVTSWGPVAAASLCLMLPVLLLTHFVQRGYLRTISVSIH
jgi:multiple sugar transport system permease protein